MINKWEAYRKFLCSIYPQVVGHLDIAWENGNSIITYGNANYGYWKITYNFESGKSIKEADNSSNRSNE